MTFKATARQTEETMKRVLWENGQNGRREEERRDSHAGKNGMLASRTFWGRLHAAREQKIAILADMKDIAARRSHKYAVEAALNAARSKLEDAEHDIFNTPVRKATPEADTIESPEVDIIALKKEVKSKEREIAAISEIESTEALQLELLQIDAKIEALTAEQDAIRADFVMFHDVVKTEGDSMNTRFASFAWLQGLLLATVGALSAVTGDQRVLILIFSIVGMTLAVDHHMQANKSLLSMEAIDGKWKNLVEFYERTSGCAYFGPSVDSNRESTGAVLPSWIRPAPMVLFTGWSLVLIATTLSKGREHS